MGLLDTLADVFSPTESGAIHYQCQRCGRQFAYRADLSDLTCPYCDSPALRELHQR